MMQMPLNEALAASPFFLLMNRLLGGLLLGKSKVLEVFYIFDSNIFALITFFPFRSGIGEQAA